MTKIWLTFDIFISISQLVEFKNMELLGGRGGGGGGGGIQGTYVLE